MQGIAWIAGGIVVLAALAIGRLVWAARASRREPTGLGLLDGRLRPCPSKPNCVSSEEGTDERHRIEPLPAGTTLDATREALLAAIRGRCAEEGCPEFVVVDEPAYVRAVFCSRLFGFRDDFEARIDMPARVVHVRSGSRVGQSDFGVNRKRVEAIRALYVDAIAAH